MKKRVVRSIRWPQDFGWRVGDTYNPPVRLASQVVRYEQEILGNEMGVPEFLLAEMDRLELRPRECLWVCLTKDAARLFARWGDGEPYRVYVGEDALVLCTDGDGGYLLRDGPARRNDTGQHQPALEVERELDPVVRDLGRELVVLAWGIELADPELVPVALRNWAGLLPRSAPLASCDGDERPGRGHPARTREGLAPCTPGGSHRKPRLGWVVAPNL